MPSLRLCQICTRYVRIPSLFGIIAVLYTAKWGVEVLSEEYFASPPLMARETHLSSLQEPKRGAKRRDPQLWARVFGRLGAANYVKV